MRNLKRVILPILFLANLPLTYAQRDFTREQERSFSEIEALVSRDGPWSKKGAEAHRLAEGLYSDRATPSAAKKRLLRIFKKDSRSLSLGAAFFEIDVLQETPVFEMDSMLDFFENNYFEDRGGIRLYHQGIQTIAKMLEKFPGRATPKVCERSSRLIGRFQSWDQTEGTRTEWPPRKEARKILTAASEIYRFCRLSADPAIHQVLDPTGLLAREAFKFLSPLSQELIGIGELRIHNSGTRKKRGKIHVTRTAIRLGEALRNPTPELLREDWKKDHLGVVYWLLAYASLKPKGIPFRHISWDAAEEEDDRRVEEIDLEEAKKRAHIAFNVAKFTLEERYDSEPLEVGKELIAMRCRSLRDLVKETTGLNPSLPNWAKEAKDRK